MRDISELELAILILVSQGEGKSSWYQIAIKLSNMDVPRSPDMMVVLKQLAVEGFLKRTINLNSPMDAWELTEMGKMILSNKLDEGCA